MDPNNRGPEEYGRDHDGFQDDGVPQRQSREPLTPDFGLQTPQQARTVQLISGDLLLTVNPVDGSEVEPCPPGRQPEALVRHTATERADRGRAATPSVPPGPPGPQLPLLERQELRERLVRLLARGRSARVTGPPGSGRTALLDAVAADCADLAPDGVVRLNGHKRTTTDLQYALFAAVCRAPSHRPGREELLGLLRGIGAVVVLDDLEFGGAGLDELLDATPECAFVLAATPDTAAPGPDAHLEELSLTGLGRAASVDLMEKVVERSLTEDEANWAGDLWFESEGLPLRFVQAGALLRHRDLLRDPEAFDGYASGAPSVPADAWETPLPSLGEGAAPAVLLASRLSEAARETLRFAVALGGEVPHQAHLPALVGDTHADAALGELAGCGLLSPAGPRYRLAAGVVAQLEAGGFGEGAADRARTAAQHYAWWAGHPSVTPGRAVAEADAVLASLAQLVPGGRAGQASVAVLLARSASPAFAAGMQWGAWEKALRMGQEGARIAGEVAEEAYFHHELGVLALCTGHLERARAELEASIGMRGALADKPGAVAGRRALALVSDRSGGPVPGVLAPVGEDRAAARYEEGASPSAGTPAALPPFPRLPVPEGTTAVISRPHTPAVRGPAFLRGARRNMVGAGAGALLVALLGTVVGLGATSGSEEPDSRNVTTEQSTEEEDGENGFPEDEATPGAPGKSGTPAERTESPGPSGHATPSAGTTPPTGPSDPSITPTTDDPSSTSPTGRPSTGSPTTAPTTAPTTKPPTTKPPTDTPTEPTDPPTEPTDPPPTTEEPPPSAPETSLTATGPSEGTPPAPDSAQSSPA
ncbi:ATP-binding protein [Streptomyces finlayi]|uniref:ATP-binding protein n=1 Tax=Streptomyces finlayi TaxID=67296 RepID=A0A7G7BHR6_9ACTN|nr:ATP-binding protein [Streptomyces finlayi]QNE74881.1 ATP-binding protein [Streptomyces finlayi]